MRKVILFMIFAVLSGLFINQAFGQTPEPTLTDEDHKITICHRTNSVTNPYVQITVDKNAADGDLGNDNGQGDHYQEHQGPLASSEEVAQGYKDDKIEWGDIIPPIEGIHDGRNWTEEGQAMWENDCNYVVEETPTPTPTPTPTLTVTPNETPIETVSPSPTIEDEFLPKTGPDIVTPLLWIAGMMLLAGATMIWTTSKPKS